ncbi:unnamed protein product [Ranitomeya imitator]|uniref:Uncharacterized protein n=1 Tax=Ranitomeya imitator TaxID=111125 RepID=A0ABN9LR78_9NEOB|nr:unnamed protein product [Ranitomeya imitator]
MEPVRINQDVGEVHEVLLVLNVQQNRQNIQCPNKNVTPVKQDEITFIAMSRDLGTSQPSLSKDCPQSTQVPYVSDPWKSVPNITDTHEDCILSSLLGTLLSPILSPICEFVTPTKEERPQSCLMKTENAEPQTLQISKKEEFLEIKDTSVNPEGSAECKIDPGDVVLKAELILMDYLNSNPLSNELQKITAEGNIGSNQEDSIGKTSPEKTAKVQNSCWATFSKALNTTLVTIKSSSDSFQQFKKAAIAKEERERTLKAQELKRRQELQTDKGDKNKVGLVTLVFCLTIGFQALETA